MSNIKGRYMGDINVEQMKEFIEFRLDKVESKVDALTDSLEKSVVHSIKIDETHSVALERIAGRVNTVFKVAGALAVIASLVFAALSYLH